MRAIRQEAFGSPEVLKAGSAEAKDVGGTHSGARRNKKVPMVKTALYAAIGVRRDLFDSLGRKPLFGDGPIASRDIHDVSAL